MEGGTPSRPRERKLAREKIEHLHAALRAIRKVNQLVFREKDPDRLLQDVCDALVGTRGYYNAWAVLTNETGAFVTAAEAGMGKHFAPMLERLKRGEFTDCGRIALRQSDVVVTASPAWECPDCPLSGTYSGSSAMTVRLEHGGRTHGLLVASIPRGFAEEAKETRLFKEIAGDIARALHTIELAEQRKRVKEERRELEANYHAIFNATNDAIFVHDAETGAILDVNARMCEMYGYNHDEALALTIAHLSSAEPPYTQGDAIRWVRRAAEGKPQFFEWLAKHKDGRLFWVEVNLKLAAIGGVDRILAVAHDITERKQLEEQLRQSQKMETVGLLAGGIAHDFSNKLCVIIGYCDMLLRKLPADDPAREPISEIRLAGQEAARLTSQLLTFSHKQPIKPKVVNLNSLLWQMHDPLKRMLGEDIRLSIASSPGVGNVLVDPTQFQQIIMNFGTNARDAMPGGGDLTIETADVELGEDYARTHPGATSGPYVMVAAKDTGEGMDADMIAHIFEPLFTTKEVGKGTGLGLATVYTIVQQAGGSIDVASERGAGTTFMIYLPRTEAPAEEATPAAAATTALPQGSETILVVEDEVALRRLIVSILRECGYTVMEAGNATEALPIGQHYPEPIHLLLTDLVMPGASGLEMAERIGRIRPDMEVLYTSGYPDETIRLHGVATGAPILLNKPFSSEDLAQRVRNMLDAAAGNRPAC